MSETAQRESWCGPSAVASAARACARRKRGRSDAIAFRVREGEEILALAHRLEEGRYFPEPGRVFVTERPKHREVHAASFRDRVVHHLIHALLEPLFEARPQADTEAIFSDASFACRKNKGTHAAAARVREHMWNLSRHGGRRVFALSMDVVSFFMSLHKPTLLAQLEPHAREVGLAARMPTSGFGPWELCRRIVLHDPTRGARRIGDLALFARVPWRKRLGALGPERGLPIGNLTSQFFANVYLTPLDHFVERTLGIHAYVRYVDDLVLLDPDPAKLAEVQRQIETFLRSRLLLDVRSKPIRPVSQGVDFVGYVLRPRYTLARRRVTDACRERLAEQESAARPIEVPRGVLLRLPSLGPVAGPLRVTRIAEEVCEALRATVASYEGHLVHASAWRLRELLWRGAFVARRLLHLAGGRSRRRFALGRPAQSLAHQIARLSQGITPEGAARPAVLVVQVGCFAEVPRAPWRFGLTRVRRRGRWCAGRRWRRAHTLVQRILDAGHPVAVALEEPEAQGNVKKRRLAYLFEPVGGADEKRRP